MKTALRIVLGLAATVVTLVLVLGLIAPKQLEVRTEQRIAAPRAQVLDQLRFMRNYPTWSPWLVEDPAQRNWVSGPDGAVGATFHWVGQAVEGAGSQTVTELADNTITIKCAITEPYASEPVFHYDLNATEDGTNVIQTFQTELPFPSNIFALVIGLRDHIAQINENGLVRLKQRTETLASASAANP
jgi:Polyketide cyclase / dehydrase and lipid transport